MVNNNNKNNSSNSLVFGLWSQKKSCDDSRETNPRPVGCEATALTILTSFSINYIQLKKGLCSKSIHSFRFAFSSSSETSDRRSVSNQNQKAGPDRIEAEQKFPFFCKKRQKRKKLFWTEKVLMSCESQIGRTSARLWSNRSVPLGTIKIVDTFRNLSRSNS